MSYQKCQVLVCKTDRVVRESCLTRLGLNQILMCSVPWRKCCSGSKKKKKKISVIEENPSGLSQGFDFHLCKTTSV